MTGTPSTITRLRHLWPHLRGSVGLSFIIPAFSCAALASIFEGLSLTLLIPAIQLLLDGGQGMAFRLIGATFLCAVLKTLFAYASALCAVRPVKQFSSELRKLIYRRCLERD